MAAYRRHLDRRPYDAAAWMQLGHNLKATGNIADAKTAYREALRIAPDVADSWVHLAHLERGDREVAIAALLRAIAYDGGLAAVTALVGMGARERLPLAVQRGIEAEESIYALSRYAAWRAAQPARAAPAAVSVLAVIDARAASAERIVATLATLGDIPWRILIDGAFSADDQIGVDAAWFREGDAIGTPPAYLLLIEAGTRIAPDAAFRLCAAVAETGAGAAYCDHDHWRAEEKGIAFEDPCFQPMFDPVWFARVDVRPPCLLVTAAAADVPDWGALFAVRLALPVAYAHVPLLLASRQADAVPLQVAPLPASGAPGSGAIQVIVQTRDAPDLLEACIHTLLATADRPDLLDIVIVDNRSILPRTAALLADWEARGIARLITHDEPFNWARANNIAVAAGDAPHLLFLNNDVEMESMRWDTALREGLAQEGAGALGALLLYPDRLIQHAGVVFGVGAGGPLHEGVGHPAEPGGPAGRWRHSRFVSAVTGAWLATSRGLFDAVGGFEEQLPVGYNDLDYCLRVRAAGQSVVQASHIVALHRESATRGIAMSPEAQARDEADWAWMRARWGKAVEFDPAYNPHWLREGRPFDGLHTPSPHAVSRWIAASARPCPWSVSPSA